ncbi:hypothetical protein [Ferruginibacter sp. SUN106]|uniref:hypothetical protein n=1 Tax=Ferruginibacter sp. SUN106 TaxID=2978348 RepID=UPI003D36EAED
MFKSKPAPVLIAVVFALTACSSNEIGDSKDVAQDKIYQGYSISYTEGNTNTEIYCQFRFAGKNGTTLVLNSPSQVQFDGEKLPVDSSAGGGAYYRTYKPAANFVGKHTLTFTTTDNKKLENDFAFDNFKLVNVPATISKKQSFNLNFETTTLQGDDYIEVSTNNTDSSFSVTHNAADKSNAIVIPTKELKRQKTKTLTLEATLYRSIPLQQSTAEGGKITISYALKPVTIQLNN